MEFGAVGDIHGDFASLAEVMTCHPEVPFWLSVGDVAADDGSYPEPPAPLYWIKGNREDFDRIAGWQAGGGPPLNLRHIPNAVRTIIPPIAVVGLGGTHAPRWYETKAANLPRSERPGGADDKRRHFVREEVEACARLTGVDVFLSHEAARPFRLERRGGGTIDAGKTPVNEILAAMKPRLHLFGHHHRFVESVRQGVRSIGLDIVSRSYLLIDADTLACRRIDRRTART